MQRFYFLVLILILLSGCTHLLPPSSAPTEPVATSEPQTTQPLATTLTDTATEISPPSLFSSPLPFLMKQYQEWKGTRYRMGSLSKSGVDCSGFVLLTFRNQFEIELPRSTSEQHKLGQEIKREQLQAGDLVFFHTGRNNHVGIYLEKNKFLHASTRAGVKISSLTDAYWRAHFWKAKRLDFTLLTK